MKVKSIALKNFRNYDNLEISFTNNINIFLGDNAQGKTNILEAIYFGAMGHSHRTRTDDELIRWQQPQCSLRIVFSRAEVESNLTFRLIQNQNKEIIINGHSIKQRELLGYLNAVIFAPEDLLLVKGIPAARRKFLDSEISQANPAYYRQLLQYNRVLSQRNHLLKKIREGRSKADMLDAWDEQIVGLAATVIAKRIEAVKKLAMLANLMHRKITNSKESLGIRYFQHGLTGQVDHYKKWFADQLKSVRSDDIQRGSTSLGPHRDDIIFTVNGVNLRNFGSQGQQRTGVLAVKLAELEFLKSETGEYPILLLDDVMSELDESRREQLLLFIKDRIQTLITATEPKYFSDIKLGQFYSVVNGNVCKL